MQEDDLIGFLQPSFLDFESYVLDTFASRILKGIYEGNVRDILFARLFFDFLSDFDYADKKTVYYVFKFEEIEKPQFSILDCLKVYEEFYFEDGMIAEKELRGLPLSSIHPLLSRFKNGKIAIFRGGIENEIYSIENDDFFSLSLSSVFYVKEGKKMYGWKLIPYKLPSDVVWAISRLIKYNLGALKYHNHILPNPDFLVSKDALNWFLKNEKDREKRGRLAERAKILLEAYSFYKYAMNMGGRVKEFIEERKKRFSLEDKKIIVKKEDFKRIKNDALVKGMDYDEEGENIVMGFYPLIFSLIRWRINKVLLHRVENNFVLDFNVENFKIGDIIMDLVWNPIANKLVVNLNRDIKYTVDHFLNISYSYNIKRVGEYFYILKEG